MSLWLRGRGAAWLWVVLFVARRVCFGERWPQRYERGVVRRHFFHWGEPSGECLWLGTVSGAGIALFGGI